MTYRHKCKQDGCYIEKHTPNWKFLEGAFKGPTSRPSDIDGFVEINSRLLILEWKGIDAELTEGQLIAWIKRTAYIDDVVVVIYGDAATTTVHAVRLIKQGELGPKVSYNNSSMFNFCGRWAKWAQEQPKRNAWDLVTVAKDQLMAEQRQVA